MLYEVITMNIVTVGALAHGNGLGPQANDDVDLRPITEANEPSPFSRVGPGARGAIKPDFTRITSYNVCYTKLLRVTTVPITLSSESVMSRSAAETRTMV